MRKMNNLSDDFSVYITIMNESHRIFNVTRQNNIYGSFSPEILPPIIEGQSQISFNLNGDIFTGAEGSVTYAIDGIGQCITFAFQCPQISNNSLSVPLNQTDFDISFYGVNQPIQWNPDRTNWGPENNFPFRGHPLYALFVIPKTNESTG